MIKSMNTKITMEHYKNFVDTLTHELTVVNPVMKPIEHILKATQVYFLETTERWIEFASLEDLAKYVKELEELYNAMLDDSRAILPKDGGKLVGITNEEWDDFEMRRYQLTQKLQAWQTFAEFCEFGVIL